MGGFDPSYCFKLSKHNRGCERTNEMHERRRDELITVQTKFYEDETDDLVDMRDRFLVALEELRQTELWKLFATEEKLNGEEILEEYMSFMEEQEKSKGCKGCFQARVFYASAPMITVQALAEIFEIRMRQQQPSDIEEICNACFALADKEQNVALNICKHAEFLSKE